MTLQQFIDKYIGTRVDFDGAYGAQCVDLYRKYVQEVWGLPQTPGVVGAYQIFDSLPAGFDKFTSGEIRLGDVMIWSEKQVKNGHVGIVTQSIPETFNAFQQNAPKSDVHGKTGSPCNIGKYQYKNLIGWFRPHVEPTPEPTPMSYKQKVLVLFSHTDLQDDVKLGIDAWRAKVDAKTEGEFTLDCTYHDTDVVFRTLNGTNTDNIPIVYADPVQIIAEGARLESELATDFDVICLIYNDNFVNGPKPTNPVENPLYQNGFNVISIPLSWISSLNDTTIPFKIYPDGVEIFFSHEMSHANYYLANVKSGTYIRDKTHDQGHGYPSPVYDFLDYLIELTPFWKFLVTSAGQGDPMIGYKHPTNDTVYLLVGSGTLVPITSWPTFVALGGSADTVVPLTQAQFAKYKLATGAVFTQG